jgi:hypothetical protein
MIHAIYKLITNRKTQMFLLLALFPVMLFAQGSEEKPKYAPGREKHRNKTDEIGRKQGQWMFFNTFGDKIAEIDFVNDVKEGVERKFYSYDKPREETEYLSGVKDGVYTKYFFSGQVQLEGAYKDGKKDGKWTKYFEDGSMRQEGAYKNGRKDGVWKSYSRKGVVVGQATYKDGVNVEELEAAKKKADEEKKAAEKKAAEKKGGIPGAKPVTPATGTAPAKTVEPKKK